MGEEAFSERLLHKIDRTTDASPALGLRLAALAGVVLGARLGAQWRPAEAELRELLGDLDGRAVGRLRRRIAASELRNRAALRLLDQSGPDRLMSLIRVRGAEVLRRLRDERIPTIVLWWHQGAVRAVEIALSGLGLPLFVATNAPRGSDSGYRWKVVVDDPGDGTEFMMQALKEIKDGAVPVLSLDTASGREDRSPFFTGSLPIPTGTGWLVARTGARLVPATSQWIGLSARIEVELHEPILEPARDGLTPAEWKRELVASGVRWWEDHLRRHPETLGLVQIRRALERPQCAARAPSDDQFTRLVEDFDSADGG